MTHLKVHREREREREREIQKPTCQEECVCTRRVLLCEKCGLRERETLEWFRVSPSRSVSLASSVVRSTPFRLFSCSVIVWVGLRQWPPFIARGVRMKEEEKICEFGQVDDGDDNDGDQRERETPRKGSNV